jgi:polyadenylate-binding protein
MAIPRPSASLYVGGLNPDVTEANLFEIFNPVGPVASIRVCRDNVTRRSLGYAYVNFHTMNDAERALDTLNYTNIKGRPCRIMWSQRDPALRKSGFGNIFIKNLDKAIDNKTLHDTFSAFGNILSCRVMTDDQGNSRGFGFVHFENAESAETAIAKVNSMLLNDKQVYVGRHVSRKERSSKSDELKKQFTNIFIKNLEESITTEQLKQMFQEFGNITSAVVALDDQGKSKGFGFVNFSTHEEAAAACDELNEKEVNGKKLFVGRAQKKSERKDELQRKFEAIKQERLSKYQGVNLFVKNLDDNVNDDGLRNEFAAYGTITSAKVQTDDKGNSKGFGFVCFSSPDEATKAVTEMNGKLVGSKPIYVALAQRKEVRRQQLEAQYAQRAQMRIAHQSGVLAAPYGPPVFYNYPAGIAPPGGQQPFVYPATMMPPRPRWNPAGQNQDVMGGYNAVNSGGVRPRPNQSGAGNRRPAGQTPGAPRYNVAPVNGMQPGQPSMPNQMGGAGRNGMNPNAAGAMGGNNKLRWSANVRNRGNEPQAQMAIPPNQVGLAGIAYPPGQEPLTAAILAAASPEDQKQMLGERLYPLVQQRNPVLAGKITGMLLEIDNSELLHLLENFTALNQKIDEAIVVLESNEVVEAPENA